MNILNVFLVFLAFYIELYMGCKLRNEKFYIDIKSSGIIASISILYSQLLTFGILSSYRIIITTLFLMGVLLLRIEKNILILLQTTFFITIVMIFSESITVAFMVNILNISMKVISANKIVFTGMNILVYLLAILIVNSKDALAKIISMKYPIQLKDGTINSIFMAAIITIFIVSYFLAYKSFNGDTVYIMLILSIFCLLLTMLFFYKDYMLKLEEEKFNELRVYTSIIEGLVEDVSKFRHDYNSILFMMKGYLEENNIEGLKMFFNTKIGEEYSHNEIPKLKKIKDAGLRGLLTSKIVQMHSENITISIEILDSIDCFTIDMIDLCRIMGILIDNAYEAAMESTDKFISISFSQDESLNVTVANSYNLNNNINVSEIYKKNYSTKGKNHGIGLSNIKEIINKKYPNILLSTYVQKDLFIQDLYIEAK